MKYGISDTKYIAKYLFCLIWIAAVIFSPAGCRTPGRLPADEAKETAPAEPNIVEIPAPEPAEPNVIEIPIPVLSEPNVVETPAQEPAEPNVAEPPTPEPVEPNAVETPAPEPVEPNVVEPPISEPEEPNIVEAPEPEPTEPDIVEAPIPAEPNLAGIPEAILTNPNIYEAIYDLMAEGRFDAAGELILYRRQQLNQLAEAVRKYKLTSQRRQSAREAAYAETMAELEKLRAKVDVNDVNDVDVNDVNDVTKVLSVIARVTEFADDSQKKLLLSDPLVIETMQKAIDNAARFEVEGKWLEAYTNCYYWLTTINPDNQGYSDYAQQLLDKAAIVISFEDSPCETREERYHGVDKRIFVRAVRFLAAYYVKLIEYDQMAIKALERGRLLGEVLGAAYESASDSQADNKGALSITEGIFEPRNLRAWLANLAVLMDEVKYASDRPTGFDQGKFLDILDEVLELNKKTVNFPEPVLIAQFVEAALSALDPYTTLVWPKEVKDFEKIMTNEFTGIGIEITKQEGLLTVASLLPDTPAYKSGLDAGDVIEKVDGLETREMTLVCAVHKITGPKGTDVTLTIKRPSEEKTWDITITRDKIVVPTIRGWQRTEAGGWLYMIDQENRIGYVRITSFSADTAPDLEKVLFRLERAGLKGLILDLRFNTGGLLESAVGVADKFINADAWIVKRQPRAGIGPAYEASHKRGTHPNYPLVILVNSYSASASEIVAGALADKKYNRAVLVGGRTHGKGSVQGITVYPGGGAQLRYTMAYYHLPSNQRVESKEAMKKLGRTDWGVGPHVEVKLRSDELKKLLEVQRDNDVLVRAGHDNVNHKPKRHTLKETLAYDPQLEVGMMIIRSKLLQEEVLAPAQSNF
jgi:carboxyl-terminal processing protease